MGRILILLFIFTQINVINVTLRIVRGIKRCLGIKINTFNVGQIMTDQRIFIFGFFFVEPNRIQKLPL